MKKQELFNHTIDILVRAYQNGTLEHANCCACAVGNIIAANCGYEFDKKKAWPTLNWKDKSYPNNWFKIINGDRINKDDRNIGQAMIEKTGYSIKELAKIERIFENAKYFDEDGYRGLMKVVDVLMEIHECNEKIVENKQKKNLCY